MNRSRWLIIIGLLISLALLLVVGWRLDWSIFLAALRRAKPVWLGVAVVVMIIDIALRALRWNLIAGEPLQKYVHFWQAVNLGYLGNYIYPARAGELLRVVALNRLANVPVGQAMGSSVSDRVADGLMLGVFTLVVITGHGGQLLGGSALVASLGVFGAAAVGMTTFVYWGEHGRGWVDPVAAYLPNVLRVRLPRWYAQAVTGAQALRQPGRLAIIAGLNLTVFLLDYSVIWLLLVAMGWQLPFLAAITVGVFVAAGASLPSAPGYVGVIQVACVLGLGLYGLDESNAVAFSVVWQLLSWLLFGVQGGGVMLFNSKRVTTGL